MASPLGMEMCRLVTGEERRELDMVFSFDHLETPGHVRLEDYRAGEKRGPVVGRRAAAVIFAEKIIRTVRRLRILQRIRAASVTATGTGSETYRASRESWTT